MAARTTPLARIAHQSRWG